jgi:hypothetical protein
LAVALTGVATGQDVCLWEFANISDVTMVHDLKTRDTLMELAGGFAYFICPDGLDACAEESNVTAPTTSEEGNSTEFAYFVLIHASEFRCHPMAQAIKSSTESVGYGVSLDLYV